MHWYVYILECSDGTYYTGITNALDKRIKVHNSGKGAKYTKGRLPVELKAYVVVPTKSIALQLEFQVKKKSKKLKIDFLLEKENEN